jgi:hypothetical protein
MIVGGRSTEGKAAQRFDLIRVERFARQVRI